MSTNKPQANGLDDKELIKRIDAIYDESRQMAMLRIGSPICFLRKGMLALITEARIDELNAVFVDFDERKLLTTGDTKTKLISFTDRLNQLKENK